jgi:hypothetical protein
MAGSFAIPATTLMAGSFHKVDRLAAGGKSGFKRFRA